MSGGYFHYNQTLIREIAMKIEEDIAKALKPKPEKIYEGYWTIQEKDYPSSCRPYRKFTAFDSYYDTESFLLAHKNIRIADPQYASGRFFGENDIIF